MSWKVFDYKCHNCGHLEERMVPAEFMDAQWCDKCETDDFVSGMKRMPAGTRTHFRFADKKLKR